MKVYNKILENLRNGIKLQSLDDNIVDKVLDGKIVRLYQCENCGTIFDEDSMSSVRTDMESFYGVGSMFPDHHYQNLSCCPNCESLDYEELGLFELDDFIDKDLFESTQWRHLAGPKYDYMDDKYEYKIMTKLIPMLNQYGIEMVQRPLEDKPGKQTYIGYDANKNKIRFNFYNQHEDKLNNREGKYDMLVTIDYKGKNIEVGVINLKNSDYLNQAFELITMSLEDLGFNLEGNSNIESSEEYSDEDEELNNLAKFKQGLSEQELMEINKS